MDADPKITITKIDAARRHLRAAIELWFVDADPVPTHTLARAAYQVVHDLNRRQKGPELLFDSSIVKEQYKRAMISRLTAPSNFMKHGGDRGNKTGMFTTISFDPDLTRGFILFAIIGLGHLQQKPSPEEKAFQLWHAFHKPEIATERWKDIFDKSFGVDAVDHVRALPKGEFFKHFLNIHRQSG